MKETGRVFTTRKRLIVLLISVVACVVLYASFYFSPPRPCSEERRKDLEYLRSWAEAYSPFVELNQKVKQLPSYVKLTRRYAELAEKATSNERFSQIAYGFVSLIGASGHSHIFEGKERAWPFESTPTYWYRTFQQCSIASPPFLLEKRGAEYVTLSNYEYNGGRLPKGSKILSVNGMPPQTFLEHLRKNTWVRLFHGRTENLERHLLMIHEGEGFTGWDVHFLLPDYSELSTVIPARIGQSPIKSDFMDPSKGNCVCLALNERVAYVRIKTFAPRFVGPDREKIHLFLDQAHPRFSKLILDIRGNPGGCTEYFYENLMKPFLSQSVSYKQLVGMKKRFLEDYGRQFVLRKRLGVSKEANEILVEETSPPGGFEDKHWVFYEITRKLDPKNRYSFNGEVFILVDNQTGSAADDFANAVKRTGSATLIGQNTHGSSAAYLAPVVVTLPKSGMQFVLEVELLVNPDGSYNELVGTPPDVRLDNCNTPERLSKSDLLKDVCIQKALSL